MGASDSKLVFKQGIFKLSERNNIPPDDAYWTGVCAPSLPRPFIPPLTTASSSGSFQTLSGTSSLSSLQPTSGAFVTNRSGTSKPSFSLSPRVSLLYEITRPSLALSRHLSEMRSTVFASSPACYPFYMKPTTLRHGRTTSSGLRGASERGMPTGLAKMTCSMETPPTSHQLRMNNQTSSTPNLWLKS